MYVTSRNVHYLHIRFNTPRIDHYHNLLRINMTEFCEDCPIRSSAVGKLVAILHGPSSVKGRLVGEVYMGIAGVLMDATGGISKPMSMPDTEEGRERLYPLVDACTGPMTERRGIFKKHEVITGCSSLGELALPDSLLTQRFLQVAKAEALNVVAGLPQELRGE